MMRAPRLNPVTRLLQPINLTAYLTWLAILADLLHASSRQLAPEQSGLAQVLMLGFLLGFVAWDLIHESHLGWKQGIIGLQALLTIAICAITHNTTAPVLSVILIAQCAMSLPVPALIVAAISIDLALFAVFALVQQHPRPWLPVLIYGGFQGFAALTAWYARSAQESAAALQRTNAHLLATRSLLAESARDQERLRLARELHDIAGHKLTALKLNLAVLQREQDKAGSESLTVAARLASELLDDIRAVVAHFREHDGIDLRQALTQLAAPLPRPRVHLDLADNVRVVSVEQAEALVRAVQEALTNIARHANADNAWISLRREGNDIRLHVHDDGRATHPVHEGNGLKGMRERFAALGGSLQLSRAAAGGVALDLTLPLSGR